MSNKELKHAIDYLHQCGLRVTTQRTNILQYLIETKIHPSAEEIYLHLKTKDTTLSLATVYNTLELFVKHQLVVSLSAKDEKQHFDYFAHPHYHVICNNCGKIEDVFDFSLDPLKADAKKQTNYSITYTSVEVFGLCPDCQLKLSNKKGCDIKP